MRDPEKNDWSKEELKRISESLSKKLGPEYISYRQGFGNTKLSYVEGWAVMGLANQIFGFNGWSTEIKSVEVDYADFCTERKSFSIGVSVTSRIVLKDGSFREDIGFGSADNTRRKCDAYEKAKKEAATDSFKRALRQFGNALGNCCYDKEYLKEIRSVRTETKNKLDVKNLLRKDAIPPPELMEDSLDLDCYDLTVSDDSKTIETKISSKPSNKYGKKS